MAWGGRTYANMGTRALNKFKLKPNPDFVLEEELIRGALRPNAEITADVIRAARYLRYGGPLLLTLGVGLSAYDVASPTPQDRGRVVAEEAGAWTGSWILSAAAVAICVLAAPETGGLSLVAIGFLGGTAGGIGGSLVADKIYYASHPHLVPMVRRTGEIPYSMVKAYMPPPPVCPHCHPTH